MKRLAKESQNEIRILDKAFLPRLRRAGFDKAQISMLAQVTPGSALMMVNEGGSVRAFLDKVT